MLAELYCFRLVRPSVCLSVCLSVCPSVRGHSNSVIFNRISSKFHIRIAFIHLSFKFEYGFCPTSDNQDGRQSGRHLSISAVVVTLTQLFLIGFFQILYMNCFHPPLVQVRLWVLSDIRQPRWPTKWPPPINIRCRGHSNSVIFNQISSKFYI